MEAKHDIADLAKRVAVGERRARLAQEQGNPWFEFWANLKTGYDAFEETNVPPTVSVQGQRYVFDQS